MAKPDAPRHTLDLTIGSAVALRNALSSPGEWSKKPSAIHGAAEIEEHPAMERAYLPEPHERESGQDYLRRIRPMLAEPLVLNDISETARDAAKAAVRAVLKAGTLPASVHGARLLNVLGIESAD